MLQLKRVENHLLCVNFVITFQVVFFLRGFFYSLQLLVAWADGRLNDVSHHFVIALDEINKGKEKSK